jgi:hypothetical protein
MQLIERKFEAMVVFMPHPTIVVFGQTQAGQFPLLLAIGREPNCEGNIVNEVRAFGLNHAPRCCFWNRSRAQLARIGGGVAPQLFNALCQESNARPIIYADSLGICIPYADPEREARRAEWANVPGNAAAHSANVFGHPIINRVSLVIMSGLTQPAVLAQLFQGAVASIEQQCVERDILHQHVRFFGGRVPVNTLDIGLTAQARQLMQHIYAEFEAA